MRKHMGSNPISCISAKFVDLILAMTHYHGFHLVSPSPWPLIGAIGAMGLAVGAVMFFHSYIYGEFLLVLSLILVLSIMIVW